MPTINKEYYPLTETFKKLRQGKDEEKDAAACAVIAVCAVTGRAFNVINKLFEKHGRKKRQGTYGRITHAVMNELGYKLVYINPRKFLDSYPEVHKRALKNVTNHHPDRFPNVWKNGKNYFFYNTQHVLAVVDGVVHDYTRATRKQVYKIEEVIKL